MMDTLIKQILNDRINELNTTMQCKVVNLSPLTIQPIPVKKYITGDTEYPLIQNVKALKQIVMVGGANFTETAVAYDIPLQVNNIVLVAFGKNDLSDAVILGVIG